MRPVPTVGMVDVLGDPRLLTRARFEELFTKLLPCCNDWRILARELVYREWLTPFQARRILDGRGEELFLGSYVLTEPLGEGGMGRVYRARNWKLDTWAAVKVIRRKRSQDPAGVERFLREVRALGAIRHPHVVHAIDADLEGGRLYYAMEYVPGIDLGRLLAERGALPIDIACRYAGQIADGLAHISALGLVHRDVKPANVLVTEDGSKIKLVDLGLARFDHPAWGTPAAGLTQTGIMIGTPDYAAPEQIRDSRQVDIRADLYSLGCTLYHMLTGKVPYDGPAAVDKLCQHQTAEPIPVDCLRADVPPAVAAVVRKLMAKRPRDRFQDPSAVAVALKPYHQASEDTLTDAAAPTPTGVPVPNSTWELPRTDEIPVEQLPLVTAATENRAPGRDWTNRLSHWLNRLHWLIAALIAGLAMGLVFGRG